MKKSKKQKKEQKKHKKEKHRRKDEKSSEESSEGEMEWVESTSLQTKAPNPVPSPDPVSVLTASKEPTPPQRREEDWLESPFLTATTSLSDIRKQRNDEREKEKEDKLSFDNPGQAARELNPYWKDGGTGLPEERDGASTQHKHQHPAPVARRMGHGVDGGISWLKKAYQRAVEQARDSGRRVDDVVAERWGSVAEYERLLAEAVQARRGEGHSRPRGPRGPSGPPPPGWRKRREEDDESDRSGRIKGPSGPPPPGWRKRREEDNESDKSGRIKGPSGPPPPGWKKKREEEDDEDDRRRDRMKEYRDNRHSSERRDDRRDGRDDRGRRDEYKSDLRDKHDSEHSRDRSSKGFMKPGGRERNDRNSLQSKFKRPGYDDDDDEYDDRRNARSDRDKSSSSHHDRESSSRDQMRHSELPSWRKTGFKKPGEDRDSPRDSRSSSSSSSSQRIPPPASSSSLSSSSGGWRKPGFKRPDEDTHRSSSSERRPSPSSGVTSSTSAASSSAGGWRKPGFEKPSSSSRDYPSSLSAPPTSSRRSRNRSSSGEDSDGDNSDDVRSSGSASSSSPDARKMKEDQEEEREKKRSPSPVKLLSDTEMNQLGAKLVKAEIMGNETQVQKLKAQIDSARQARIAHKTKLLEKKDATNSSGQKRTSERTGPRREEEEVILTRTDHSGQSWPLAEQTAAPGSGKKIRKKNIVTHDKGGERERYFADDDEMDLETMVRREKMGSVDDHNKLLNKVASKKLALLDSEFNTLDEMFVVSAAKAESKSNIEERQRSKAIAEHRRTMATLSKCPFCLESGDMKKHLIVALGLKVYLCVPETRCISEGQCYIVPMQHTVASTALDEDVWAEIQVFRKGLTRMFEDHEMDVAFLETCMNPKKQRHMCIECLPIPRELGEMAPIYFKKAIQESESEWSQNKKLIETSKKDIRHSVPRGFPFFSVDFGLDGGFAHVIEDEQVFPHYFGKEVVGGLLDVEPRLWRHPPRENFEDQSKRVLQLSQWWKPFDWTQKIDREKS